MNLLGSMIKRFLITLAGVLLVFLPAALGQGIEDKKRKKKG